MAKAELFQSSASQDPSEVIKNMLIWCSRNIYFYYQCWKQLCSFFFRFLDE